MYDIIYEIGRYQSRVIADIWYRMSLLASWPYPSVYFSTELQSNKISCENINLDSIGLEDFLYKKDNLNIWRDDTILSLGQVV